MPLNRRQFAVTASSLASAASLSANSPDGRPLRVAVMGHTGRGNFGHGLDTVWLKLDATEIVGVADGNPDGLPKALKKLKLNKSQGFVDYKQMLAKVSPDLIAVCPRRPDQRRDMILAAIRSGAKGIYVEKPYVRTPAEADEITAAIKQHNTKLAVAHRNRYHPTLTTIAALIKDGSLGKVLEIRGRGKGDRRGGAEDLWVLGSHIFNMMNFYAGKPLECSATMMQDDRPVVKADVYDGAEALGLLAGNRVHARYRFDSGIIGYFDSIANDQTANAGFGMQIVGSKGIVAIGADQDPLAHFVPGNPFLPTDKPRPWLPISSAGIDKPEPDPTYFSHLYDHQDAAVDLIASIAEDRLPLCNHLEAATTVEMICAVFESHRRGGATVALPLAERDNPLAKLSR